MFISSPGAEWDWVSVFPSVVALRPIFKAEVALFLNHLEILIYEKNPPRELTRETRRSRFSGFVQMNICCSVSTPLGRLRTTRDKFKDGKSLREQLRVNVSVRENSDHQWWMNHFARHPLETSLLFALSHIAAVLPIQEESHHRWAALEGSRWCLMMPCGLHLLSTTDWGQWKTFDQIVHSDLLQKYEFRVCWTPFLFSIH